MATYPPPTDNFPIFDALAFTIPLRASITLGEADARYLARTDIAISVAQTTAFSDNITIGNALLDYIPAQGLQIKPSVNSEAVFIRTLDAGGATKQRIECNQTHTHLYDQTRITDSTAVTEYTSLQQTAATMDYYNNSTSGTMNFRVENSGGVAITPLAITSNTVTIAPSIVATGLKGLDCQSAFFGRDDTGANTFNGTLGYTRHPVGWTISASKAVAIPTSNVAVDVISVGTPITVFNTLSNGVWRISCSCNNSTVLGVMTYLVMSWGSPTGATIINGTTAQLFHQTTAGLSNMGLPYPDLIIRTTGNGITGLVCNLTVTYSVQPTITFNLWATKLA